MTSAQKSPTPAATGAGRSENLSTGISTPNSTGSPETATKPPRPRVFHLPANEDDPDTIHTLCGKSWPRHRAVRGSGETGRLKRDCEHCIYLDRLEQDLRKIEQQNIEFMVAIQIVRKYLGGGDQ